MTRVHFAQTESYCQTPSFHAWSAERQRCPLSLIVVFFILPSLEVQPSQAGSVLPFLAFDRSRMYQWRKFEFFEEKLGGKSAIPEDVKGRIECSSSGRGKLVIGCDDGTVSLLDRGLKFNYGFQAHSSSVLFVQQLKVRSSLRCLCTQCSAKYWVFDALSRRVM